MFVKNLLQDFADCQQNKSLSRPIWKNDKHSVNSFRRAVNVRLHKRSPERLDGRKDQSAISTMKMGNDFDTCTSFRSQHPK